MFTEFAGLDTPAPATPATRRADARLLQYQPGRRVAIAAAASIELLEGPAVIEVPGAPYYCAGLVRWQGRLLALVDLRLLLRAYADEVARAQSHVLVVAYQRAPGGPLEYGALAAPALVQMAQVGDEQACELPGDSDLWPYIASACFTHEGAPVPVLDVARVFGQAHG